MAALPANAFKTLLPRVHRLGAWLLSRWVEASGKISLEAFEALCTRPFPDEEVVFAHRAVRAMLLNKWRYGE